jgi:hypothetical protein
MFSRPEPTFRQHPAELGRQKAANLRVAELFHLSGEALDN